MKTVGMAAVVFLLVGALLMCGAAQGAMLVYEGFDYTTGTPSGPTGNGVALNGQGGAELGFATGSTWSAFSNNGTITVYPQGTQSGVNLNNTGPVVLDYDGTATNLPTSGGYVGMSGSNVTDHMNFSRPLAPSVTATFIDGATTWFSFVSVRGYAANPGGAKLAIGEAPLTNDSRGGTSNGEAIGGGGGLGSSSRNIYKVYPQFWDQTTGSPGETGGSFGNYDVTGGPQPDSASTITLSAPYAAEGITPVAPQTEGLQSMLVDYDIIAGAPTQINGGRNIIVGKIEWHDGVPDVISVVTFEKTDVISEATFDAMILAQPLLKSSNWTIQPDLDQSQFDTISLAGGKWFYDEVRLATTFNEVAGAPEPATLALLAFGGIAVLRRRRRA